MSHRDTLIDTLLAHHTKKNLAAMLANAMLTGELPAPPVQLDATYPPRFQGRLTATARKQRREYLKGFLLTTYPAIVHPNELSKATGLSVNTLVRWSRDKDTLEFLGDSLADYYKIIIDARGRRLTSFWRGILDLHNYLLSYRWGWAQLPLYEAHSRLWGISSVVQEATLEQLNRRERTRLGTAKMQALLSAANWPHYQVDQGVDVPDMPIEPMGCPLMQMQETHPTANDLYIARYVLDADLEAAGLSWIETETIIIGSRPAYDVVAVTLGVLN